MKLKAEHSHKIFVMLLGLVAFTLPFSIRINTWTIILCGLYVLWEGRVLAGLKAAMHKPYVWLLWLYFLLHVFSALLSNNHTEGWAIVERKASFFVFPFVFYSYSLTKEDIKKICSYFVVSVLMAFAACLSAALYNYYYLAPDYKFFFYQNFTTVLQINAVYLAAYCVIAMHMVVYFYKEVNRVLVYLALIALVMFCIMLNSKMMLACLCIGFIIYGFLGFTRKSAWLVSGCVLAGVISAVYFILPVRERIMKEVNTNMSVVQQDQYMYDTPFTGASLRLVLWKFSVESIQEHNAWIKGVSTGDFQDILNKKYHQKGLYTGNAMHGDTGYLGYGPHSQYVEVFLSLGLTGIIVFVSLLFYYVRNAWLTLNYMALQCVLLFILFFFSESVLSVNKGIVPFAFFTLLFIQMAPGQFLQKME
jgi:O-antigen ligase